MVTAVVRDPDNLTEPFVATAHFLKIPGEHGIYFDGLRDYTVGPAADCVARGGTDAGPSSMGGTFCY